MDPESGIRPGQTWPNGARHCSGMANTRVALAPIFLLMTAPRNLSLMIDPVIVKTPTATSCESHRLSRTRGSSPPLVFVSHPPSRCSHDSGSGFHPSFALPFSSSSQAKTPSAAINAPLTTESGTRMFTSSILCCGRALLPP